MATAYIGVGSNIEPERNIPAALALLRLTVDLLAISTFYRTAPVGRPDSPVFVNGVVKVETDIPPRELKFETLRAIEQQLGRARTAGKYAPRTIDLDLLVYDDLVVREPDLVVPDTDIQERAFVAVPLAELAPDLALPDSGRGAADLAASMDARAMTAMPELTQALRKELLDES